MKKSNYSLFLKFNLAAMIFLKSDYIDKPLNRIKHHEVLSVIDGAQLWPSVLFEKY